VQRPAPWGPHSAHEKLSYDNSAQPTFDVRSRIAFANWTFQGAQVCGTAESGNHPCSAIPEFVDFRGVQYDLDCNIDRLYRSCGFGDINHKLSSLKGTLPIPKTIG
jgi:hypothetical protein